MFNENTLKAMRGALFIRKQSMGDIKDQHTAEAIMLYEGTLNALALVDSMLRGDTIASIWSIDDVKSLADGCSIGGSMCHNHMTQVEDGIYPEASNDEPISDETARQVLRLAEENHDAEIGINWDSLRYHLEQVQG